MSSDLSRRRFLIGALSAVAVPWHRIGQQVRDLDTLPPEFFYVHGQISRQLRRIIRADPGYLNIALRNLLPGEELIRIPVTEDFKNSYVQWLGGKFGNITPREWYGKRVEMLGHTVDYGSRRCIVVDDTGRVIRELNADPFVDVLEPPLRFIKTDDYVAGDLVEVS